MSAVCASPADSGALVFGKVPLDKVRALQHTLYRTAKADPGHGSCAGGQGLAQRRPVARVRAAESARNRCGTQGQQALAGEAECRR